MTRRVIPATELRLAFDDNGTAEPGTQARTTYDLIAEEFGPGYNAALVAGPGTSWSRFSCCRRVAAAGALALIETAPGPLQAVAPVLPVSARLRTLQSVIYTDSGAVGATKVILVVWGVGAMAVSVIASRVRTRYSPAESGGGKARAIRLWMALLHQRGHHFGVSRNPYLHRTIGSSEGGYALRTITGSGMKSDAALWCRGTSVVMLADRRG